MYSKLMIPVDLKHTDQLDKALTIAAELVKSHGAQAHLVGVTMSSPTEIARTPEEFAAKLATFAADCSNKLGAAFTPHTEISHDMTIDLDHVLERTADKIGADLIVMATHIPGLADFIFSSNAGYIASHASISVLVVR